MNNRERRIARSKVRRATRRMGGNTVPDPLGIAGDVAAFVAAQAGNAIVQGQPVHVIGCYEGILLIFQASLGDGLPAWVFQRLDEDFLKKLREPFLSIYTEWRRLKPWGLSFREAIDKYERRMAGGQEPRRIEGVSAIVVDAETLTPLRPVLVDKAFVETLSRSHPIPAAPLVAAAVDGGVIGFMYEREPRQYVMRVERIPDEEFARLGLTRHGEATVDVVRARLIDHMRTNFAGAASPEQTVDA